MGKRFHKHGCRRDNYPVGDIGRLEDFQYSKLLREKGIDTHLKRTVDKSKITRLTEEEYKEHSLAIEKLRLQASANRKRRRDTR